MTATKHWVVDIYIDEHDDESTRAEARLHARDAGQLKAVGFARRNPHDVNVPEIGDELATARALSELAQRLLQATSEDIEDVTHQPARLAQ